MGQAGLCTTTEKAVQMAGVMLGEVKSPALHDGLGYLYLAGPFFLPGE